MTDPEATCACLREIIKSLPDITPVQAISVWGFRLVNRMITRGLLEKRTDGKLHLSRLFREG